MPPLPSTFTIWYLPRRVPGSSRSASAMDRRLGIASDEVGLMPSTTGTPLPCPPSATGVGAGPGPVGAPEVDHRPVDDHRLDVDPRAEAHLEPPLGRRLPVEVAVLAQLFDEGARGWSGVQDPDFDPVLHQIVEHLEHRAVRP